MEATGARYLTDLEWRICHAINIYVYRNGRDGESPILVHIPPAKKKNMKTILSAIQERVAFPVGYPTHMYGMDGKRIKNPCDLEMYQNYVVASNYDKHFKCVQYGRKRSPLLVLNRDSKHIRVLRLHNQNYQDWVKRDAIAEERPRAPHNFPHNEAPTGEDSGYYPNQNQSLKGGDTYRVDNKSAQQSPSFQSQPRQQYQQQYAVMNSHSALTENPEALQALYQMQQPYEIQQNPQQELLVPSETFEVHKASPRPVQIVPEPINSKFLAQEAGSSPIPSIKEHVPAKRYPEPVNQYPASRRLLDYDRISSSTNLSTAEPETSYEDIQAKYNEMLKHTRRRDKKLKRMLENPTIVLPQEPMMMPFTSDEVETKTVEQPHHIEHHDKYDSSHHQMLVLPPPPPQFRDEVQLVSEKTGLVQKIFFLVNQNQ